MGLDVRDSIASRANTVRPDFRTGLRDRFGWGSGANPSRDRALTTFLGIATLSVRAR